MTRTKFENKQQMLDSRRNLLIDRRAGMEAGKHARNGVKYSGAQAKPLTGARAVTDIS